MGKRSEILIIVLVLFTFHYKLSAQDSLPEFQVKRKNVFEFTKEPTISKSGDIVTIEFTVKEYCDATVAIENKNGDILKHLASGVLGDNAPIPFKQGSLQQKLTWDSKDDRGKYVDDIGNTVVRVSLGLKPTYEKDLYTSPYKRISGMTSIAAGPEGIYVFEGYGRDELRLFSHKGEYIKTIYPFPASQIEKVKGLTWSSFANREKIPTKYSDYHQTLLSSGNNGPTNLGDSNGFPGMHGKAATTIAVQGNRLALGFESINRILTDGSTGGLSLLGPQIGVNTKDGRSGNKMIAAPTASAFSPDGKTVYYTAYLWHYSYVDSGLTGNIPVVMKFDYESNEPATVFAGSMKQEEFGSGPDQFNTPSSVDTDLKGNVYVTDFCNDRVQIFEPSGKLLKSLSTPKPSRVLIHKVTNEVYVFSYPIIGVPLKVQSDLKYDYNKIPKRLATFSAYPELTKLSDEEFPIGEIGQIEAAAIGNTVQIALDSWSKTPTIWIAAKKFEENAVQIGYHGFRKQVDKEWTEGSIRRLEKVDSKWVEVDNFARRAEKDLVRPTPPAWNNQHLFVNPKNKKLYIGEPDSGPTKKAFSWLIEVDTDSGASKIVKLPFNPMDIAFDLEGLIYMRTMAVLGRYNMDTWTEVPFDYGAELSQVGGDGGMGGSYCSIISALMLPATNAVCYHQGGLDVNVNGDILIACHNRPKMEKNNVPWGMKEVKNYSEYRPDNFPGRLISATSVCLHVWDKQGKVKFQDMVQGCPQIDGAFLDANNNVYLMAVPARQSNDKLIDDGRSQTLMKFKPKKGRFISKKAEIPLQESQIPKRPQEIIGFWVEDYEWMYGGVGFAGFNEKAKNGGCACWYTRFKLDYFARSFAPEPMQYSVAVLDSNGNLITRIGRYGNIDSAGHKSKEPLGGDEVGLFHPCFVGTLTDKKLFISDIGNERIVSVKLGYYKDVILPINK